MNFKELAEKDIMASCSTDEFGTEALYIPKIGSSYPVSGIYDESGSTEDLANTSIITTQPIFTLPVSLLKTNPGPGDLIQIGIEKFHIRESLPDGTGFTDLLLTLSKSN